MHLITTPEGGKAGAPGFSECVDKEILESWLAPTSHYLTKVTLRVTTGNIVPKKDPTEVEALVWN